MSFYDFQTNFSHIKSKVVIPRAEVWQGHVDVFYGNMIAGCEETVLAEGPALLIVTHNGIDGWKGDWIRIVLDGGAYLQCPMGFMLDDFESANLSCT